MHYCNPLPAIQALGMGIILLSDTCRKQINPCTHPARVLDISSYFQVWFYNNIYIYIYNINIYIYRPWTLPFGMSWVFSKTLSLCCLANGDCSQPCHSPHVWHDCLLVRSLAKTRRLQRLEGWILAKIFLKFQLAWNNRGIESPCNYRDFEDTFLVSYHQIATSGPSSTADLPMSDVLARPLPHHHMPRGPS